MRILSFSLVTVAILGCAWLGWVETAGGRFSTSFHIDGANHLSIAETLWQGNDPAARENFLILHKYPNLAHRIVAVAAKICGIDLLRSMAAINGILVYVGCLLVALRWATLIRRRRQAVSEASLLLGIGAAGLTTIFGLGSMVHHFQANYFFPHIFSTVLAMLLLLLLQSVNRRWVQSVIFLIGTLLLVRMHLVGALWFILAALTYMLGVALHLRGVMHTGLLGLVAALIGALTPEVRNMVSIAEGNGGVILPLGNLTEQVTLIGATILVPLVLLLYHGVVRYRRGGWGELASILADHAGLIAIIALALVMTGALCGFGKGSMYGLAKLNYLLVMESIGLAFVFAPAPSGPDVAGVRGKLELLWVACIAAACFVAQQPWKLGANFDQERLIFYRENLLQARPDILSATERLYPQFSLPPWANFYLYLGVLQQGVDLKSWSWYESDCSSGPAIPAGMLKKRMLPSDGTIHFAGPANCWRYQLAGWDNPESNGCWTSGSPARVMMTLDEGFRPQVLKVEALAFVPLAGDEMEVEVWINGMRSTRWRFSHPADFIFNQIPERVVDLSLLNAATDRVWQVDFVIVRRAHEDLKGLFVSKITLR